MRRQAIRFWSSGGDAGPLRRRAGERCGGTLAEPARAERNADDRRRKFARRPPSSLSDSPRRPPPPNASSFERLGQAWPFLVPDAATTRLFRSKIAPLSRRSRANGAAAATAATAVARRRSPKGIEDQNESGDCGARARPLMSPGGTVARGGVRTQGGGRPNTTGRTAGNGAVPASIKRTSRGRVAEWTISCSSSSMG